MRSSADAQQVSLLLEGVWGLGDFAGMEQGSFHQVTLMGVGETHVL